MKHISSFTCILMSICLLSFNISCSKSSDSNSDNNNNTSGYYMKFKVDGVQRDFRAGVQATLTDNSAGSNSNYQAIMISFKDDNAGGTINSMSVCITIKDPIIINKTYSDNSEYGLTPEGLLIYFNEVGSDYYSINPDLVTNTSVNVTLTEMTSTRIKGTFSGKVYGTGSLDFHEISNGEFNLVVK